MWVGNLGEGSGMAKKEMGVTYHSYYKMYEQRRGGGVGGLVCGFTSTIRAAGILLWYGLYSICHLRCIF